MTRRFDFAMPDTMAEALRLLAEAGEGARVLGGGSALVPALSMGLDRPDLVLDPRRLDLDGIRRERAGLRIGARATYAAIKASTLVRTDAPLLAAMADEVTGGPGLWNVATLGGAACYGNPASDGPGCLTALDAAFVLRSVRGTRQVPATRFFLGPFSTAREPDEMLTDIVVPVEKGPSTYIKVKNSASSWPVVTGSCLLVGGAANTRIRLCIGAAGPTPIWSEWPHPGPFSAERVGACAREIASKLVVEWVDELAGPGYRRAVAPNVAARALAAVSGARP